VSPFYDASRTTVRIGGVVLESSPIVVNIPGAKLLSSKGAGANCSDHRMVKAKEKKRQRRGANARVLQAYQALGYLGFLAVNRSMFARHAKTGKPPPVARVLFTRICPKRHFCDEGDNLSSLFKPTRDGTADALGVDDNLFVPTHPSMPVQYGKIGVWYEQIDGDWGVSITVWPRETE
jgi:hypothetical protein